MYLYTSASNEAPKIKNEYGSLNKVINYIIDGGSQHIITRIENYSESKAHTIKIYYAGDTCPYAVSQTIDITGSTYPEYNKSFFIEVINSVEKYMICYRSDITSNIPTDESASIKMKIHNAGFTRKHGGLSEKITVIKFVGGMEYRIDDRDIRELTNPPIVKDSENEKWFKCARVTMSGNFDSLYSSIERTYPVTPIRPDQVYNVVNNNFSPAYIRYTKIDTSQYLTNTTSPSLETTYKIFADEVCMYIILNDNSDARWKFVYVIGGFESLNPEIKNGVLFSQGYNGYFTDASFLSYNLFSSSTYPYHNVSNLLFNCEDSYEFYEMYTQSIIYDNGSGSYDRMRRSGELSVAPSLSAYPFGTCLATPNKINNAIYFCDAILTSARTYTNTTYYGKLHHIKWCCNNMGSNGDGDGGVYEIDGDKYYEYLHSCQGNTTNTTKNYIKLTIE